MRTYNKRIAFLISDQHFIPHGGIGSFCKSFTEMCKNLNWKVDIILDKSPNNDDFKLLIESESVGGRIICPKDPLPYKKQKNIEEYDEERGLTYTDHVASFAFSDTINFEKIVNFRKSIYTAFQTNMYDMIICNTQEAMTAAYAINLTSHIPVLFYTHLHSMIFRKEQNFADVFLPSYHNFYNKHMELPDIYIGTQSQKNIDEIEKYRGKDNRCVLLPMPMSERGLLKTSTHIRKGVLFIGRWEEGKNPEAYIRVMKECGLPCKVMTNENGKKKFEKAFNEADITDYEIKAGITGQDKVDFITSASIFFMPSLRENYPFAFLECLGHMPCVVLDNQDWSDNFDSTFYHKVNINNAAETIKKLYDVVQPQSALDYVKQLDDTVAQSWVDFLNCFVAKKSNNKDAGILQFVDGGGSRYATYIEELKRKPHIAVEDFESVLSNRHTFKKIVYTDTDTYFSNDEKFTPIEEGLFVWQ